MSLLGVVPDWHRQAACRGAGNEQFFPPRGSPGAAGRHVIDTYCAHCPVRHECLEAALENGERYGVWGGTTEFRRKAMRKHRLKPCRGCGAMFHPSGSQQYCTADCYNRNRKQA